MPIQLNLTNLPQPQSGFLNTTALEGLPELEEENGPGLGTAVGVGGALAALLALSPKTRGIAGSVLKGANALRQQLMLSGYALPKSVMGGVGAVGERALETGSLTPIRQLFKMQTLKDVGTAYRNNASIGPTPGVLSSVPNPGKIMGAFDDAFSRVLQRSGASPVEAKSAMLQTPLGKLGTALESDVARAIHPFRRTPVNAFIEGYEKLKGGHPKTLAAYLGAGAVHGAATADDDLPVSIPLAIAASARYGVPYGLGSLVGRGLTGANVTGTGVASSMVPFSEYGTEQATSLPGLAKPFLRPGFVKILEDLTGGGR